MNKLEFMSELRQIENSLKYVHEYESVIRKYTEKIYYCNGVNKNKLIETEFKYRLVMAAYRRFNEKSSKVLPGFVYDWIESTSKAIMTGWFETLEVESRITYDHFMLIFGDTLEFHFPTSSITLLSNFAEVVLDNPLPFDSYSFCVELSGTQLYIGQTLTKSYTRVQAKSDSQFNMIYALEDALKHTKLPDKSKYPIINSLIDEAYIDYCDKTVNTNPNAVKESLYLAENLQDLIPKIDKRIKQTISKQEK